MSIKIILYTKIILSILLFPSTTYGQVKTFEIFGTVSGELNNKIYLFFDGNYKQKDSISADIVNGSFYIQATAPLPSMARFHLGRQSYIQDVYIDNRKTYLTCTNKLDIYGADKDTMNMFTIVNVKGSNSETAKRNFEDWLAALKISTPTEEERNQEYHDKLYDFVSNNPKSKVSLYLIGKASTLRYSQVQALTSLVDTTLKNTFEWKGIQKLLNSLDRSKNSAKGMPFLDVSLRDTSGTMFSTKSLRGKFVLVDFWASWCKPCRQANPELSALYSKLKDTSFEILGVSFDKDAAKWKGAIIKDGLLWKQVVDEKGFYSDLGRHYDIEAIPQSILLNKEGKIIGSGLTVKEIEKVINEAISSSR